MRFIVFNIIPGESSTYQDGIFLKVWEGEDWEGENKKSRPRKRARRDFAKLIYEDSKLSSIHILLIHIVLCT